MNLLPILLLVTSSILVLRTGDRISVDGAVEEKDGVAVFKTAEGQLFSLPSIEIDREATKKANDEAAKSQDDGKKKLKVSPEEKARLLKELEQNHSGKAATTEQRELPKVEQPSKEETREKKDEERRWRADARAHREAIKQAEEERDLLLDRRDRLRSEISGLVSLGYKPSQFTYQSTQLAHVEEQIPYAQLEVERAKRAWTEFQEEARKEDVPPGWLRP